MSIPGIEFVAPPNIGRIFRSSAKVRLGDIAPNGCVRLDALARILQDLSSDDTADASDSTSNSDDGRVWVLRRLALRGHRLPTYRADLDLTTWCSGVGPRWAERRSDIVWGDARRVEAVALWACTDIARGAPIPLGDRFEATFGVSAAHRRVSARRLLPGPPSTDGRSWVLRATDFDALGHVNNANYWAPMEESLADERTSRPASAPIDFAIMEFRGGVDRGERVAIVERRSDRSIEQWWLVDGDLRASALVALAP